MYFLAELKVTIDCFVFDIMKAMTTCIWKAFRVMLHEHSLYFLHLKLDFFWDLTWWVLSLLFW
jgi:hypothetical protein